MRLPGVERGQPHRRLQLALMGTVFEGGVPDIVKVRYYRPGFFGKPLFRLAQALLRGPSPWTVGERELFGAFVSARNQCPF